MAAVSCGVLQSSFVAYVLIILSKSTHSKAFPKDFDRLRIDLHDYFKISLHSESPNPKTMRMRQCMKEVYR